MAAKVNPRDTYPLLLNSLMDRGAFLQPDNLIITKIAGGYHQVTFREHLLKAKRLASALDKWGVKIGDAVGTLMWNSGWHLHAYHALSCMGAILHTLNLRLGPRDLGYIIEHAGDRVVIVDADLLKLMDALDDKVLARIELIVVVGEGYVTGKWDAPAKLAAKCTDFEAFLSTGSENFAWPMLPETATHALCYTSGTTGMPKGVAYSQRSTYLHTLAIHGADQLNIRGADVVLPFVPMFHVLSWGVPFATLMLGTRAVFSGRFMDPASILECFVDWKVTLSTGVPTVWQGVRALVESKGVDAYRSQLALQTLTCGGSSPPAEMMNWFFDSLGVEFVQGWGMTETNPLGTLGRKWAKYKDLSRSPDDLNRNMAKAGLLMPGLELRIADQDNMDKDMPYGESGELLIRGPWIIQEYFKNPAEEKFHKGWLITGDIAKLDEEGAVIISDRSKDVVKSGGEWISSIDMENLVASMSEIAMAAVVAMPHPKWDERPVVIAVLAQGASEGGLADKVRAHLSSDFAKFQLPDDVLVWPAIPMTSTGKIDKKVIRAKLSEEGYVLPDLRQSKL
mmetsp:Transcript_98202/g.194515  ORF Transcript_98202/g.194515 Transcript_98202/m.194515 type:complete len:565 (+) Transcript_98202:64-1758(+)